MLECPKFQISQLELLVLSTSAIPFRSLAKWNPESPAHTFILNTYLKTCMWLPISLRIKAKALTIVYKALCKLPPSLLPPVSYPKTFYVLIFPTTLSSVFLQYIRHVSVSGPLHYPSVQGEYSSSWYLLSSNYHFFTSLFKSHTITKVFLWELYKCTYPTTLSHLSCCIFLTVCYIICYIFLFNYLPEWKLCVTC